jgi:hypothetical protein
LRLGLGPRALALALIGFYQRRLSASCPLGANGSKRPRRQVRSDKGNGMPFRTMAHCSVKRIACTAACLAAGALAALVPAAAQDRANYFNDPFLQVTTGIADCPVPKGPEITVDEMRAQAHLRTEKGTSCYQSGQCRLPNAYLYDQEIIPRVKKAIEADGRFAQTSVWAEGQRRWVYLKGCVRSAQQSQQLEQLVRRLDDVEAVINQLVVRLPAAR